MTRVSLIGVAALAAFTMSLAAAQPAGGPGTGPMAAGPGASGPGMGMGMRHGHGAGRWGSGYTPGWALMTPQERDAHREQMRTMHSYDDCKAYHAQHHEQMAARAKERGQPPLAQPRRDACRALKP